MLLGEVVKLFLEQEVASETIPLQTHVELFPDLTNLFFPLDFWKSSKRSKPYNFGKR